MVNAREIRNQLEKITNEQTKLRDEELVPMRAEVAALTARDQAYTNAINALTVLLQSLPPEESSDGRASLATAIVDLLRERGIPMSAQDIWETLEARGYTTKVTPAYNAIHFGIRDKIAPKGPVERVSPGVWKWVGDKPSITIQ